ncbi:MAG: DNA-binding protein [Clostridiales bacterium 41_21_two_genomes]|nr:MAG: DNA-binding protein [Clostridiales bacterium 41_21_two_genomes]
MNKKELVAAISEKSGLKKVDVDKALDAFTAVTAEALAAGDKIQLVGFGTFEVAERPARQARNPKNGQMIEVAASKTPRFKVGKALKNSVNS